jgi:Na+-driven multidrug efflux pump
MVRTSSRARHLRLLGLADPFLGLGFTVAYAFQAAGRPLWPFLGISGRVLVVGAGGWVAIHWTEAGLLGLALAALAGLVVYGSTLAAAFPRGAWRSDVHTSTRPIDVPCVASTDSIGSAGLHGLGLTAAA